MNEDPKSKPAGLNGPNNSITVLDQRATFADAKKIAGERQGRLPSLQDFIRAMRDPKQLEKLRGDWYWISEEKIPDGYCRIDYDQGTLIQVAKKEWDVLPAEQKAFILTGTGAVGITVGDYWFGGRMYGGAGAGPSNGFRVACVGLGGEKPPVAPK